MWYSMWYASLCLVITSMIVITSVCQTHSRPPKKKRHRKKRKERKKAKPWSPFWRCKLPYHLVMWCHSRVSNRLKRIFGHSRGKLRMARKEKRTRYRRRRKLRKYLSLYKAWLTGPPLRFKLEEPNISLI